MSKAKKYRVPIRVSVAEMAMPRGGIVGAARIVNALRALRIKGDANEA